MSVRYQLIVRQQPNRARMCGFSDLKDRRLIDPPPILQLVLQAADGSIVRADHFESPNLVCHASLWAPNGLEERSFIAKSPRSMNPTPSSAPDLNDDSFQAAAPAKRALRTAAGQSSGQPYTAEELPVNFDTSSDALHSSVPPSSGLGRTTQLSTPSSTDVSPTVPHSIPSASQGAAGAVGARGHHPKLFESLLGSIVVPCLVLLDVDGTEGMFFVFSDLSVRLQGLYRLKFQLVDVRSVGRQSSVMCSAWTDVFEVFAAKTFPGMTESTVLSRTFANQGIPIHIRRDYSSLREPL
ncbi:velvet factor [Zopfochytrium polystomum]|nr:velvet factor [Zopfochytrium polystomum]